MFRIVSIVGIVGMTALMFHVRKQAKWHGFFEGYARSVRTVIAFMTFLCAALLALSGFTATVIGRPMTGYFLLGHVAVGGAFIVCLAATALLWGEAHGGGELKNAAGIGAASQRWGVIRETCFWCFVAFGCGSAVTILLGMVPVFDSESVGVLSELHRWCALLVVMAGIGFGASK